MRDYTRIEAWKLADDLTVRIYEVTKQFPRQELYGLTNQIRRAAMSVAANIVEGASRGTKRDYLHFLYIARASSSERHYFIHLAKRLGFLSAEEAGSVEEQSRSALACLAGLIRAVESESGVVAKAVATFSSLVVLTLARLLSSPCP